MPRGENNRKLSDAQRAEAVRLYMTPAPDGTWVGVPTIARHFGVRNGTIQRILRLAGVKTRDARESHSKGKRCRPITNLPKGRPPKCKCGCGQRTPWLRRKKRWAKYAEGHYSQRGEQNPSWNNGSSLQPYPYDWREVAAAIRKRDDYTCQKCGSQFAPTSGLLHVHHRNRDRSDNSNENLVTLCRWCHARAH